MSAAHGFWPRGRFSHSVPVNRFARLDRVAIDIAIDMEVHAVNLALRLNMLAVCVVFVFVGAVLLGAF
jgi:hypothetical protein